MRIAISGPPGSGKSTVCRKLSEILGIEFISSGEIFREMARQHNLTLEEFGELAMRDSRYDIMLDEQMLKIARERAHIILEGRLVAHLLAREGISAFKVFLDAKLGERVRRVAEREGINVEEAQYAIQKREECEIQRYKKHYDIDIRDTTVYDLIVDTTDIPPEEVVNIILARIEENG